MRDFDQIWLVRQHINWICIQSIQNSNLRTWRPSYESLGQNLVDSISILLKEKDIKFLSIYFRIKSSDSFFEKIERKEYKDPLNEIEDIEDEESIPLYKSKIRDKQFQQMIEALQDVYGKPKNTTAK